MSTDPIPTGAEDDAEAFFLPLADSRYAATVLTRGPWDRGAQHAGPPSALLGRAIEACEPRDDMIVARVALDILRPVPITTFEVAARVRRGGRNVELVESSLLADGVEVMRAAAWRIRLTDPAVRPTEPVAPPPGPENADALAEFPGWADVGYHTAIEWRFVAGAFFSPGPAKAWMRMRYPLVAGEEPSPLTRVLIAADSGNGVSGVVNFNHFYAINTDLTVHLHRHPVGEWVCLDAETTIDHDGVGLAASIISDERSVIGRGSQSLFVAAR
jgi:hypothetical protein